MHNSTGFETLNDIIKQLQSANAEPGKRIATLTIDTIFFELESELNLLLKNEVLKIEFLEKQIETCHKLSVLTYDELTALKKVKHLNDHQFYCFVRLKKIYSNLSSFHLRYETIAKELNVHPQPTMTSYL